MNPHNYISDIQQLEKWFRLQNCPKWGLYRGFHERMPERSVIHKQREEQLSIDESWQIIEDQIMIHGSGGGKFTLFVPNFGAAKGVSALFGLNLHTSMAPGISGQASPASVGMLTEVETQRRITEALEKQAMARKIEDLEAAIGHKSNFQDILMEKVLQLDPDRIMDTLTGFLGTMMQRPQVPVQMRGLEREKPAIQQPPADGTGFEYDGERLVAVLDPMRSHFSTDDEFMVFLEKVSARFCEHPEMFKSMI